MFGHLSRYEFISRVSVETFCRSHLLVLFLRLSRRATVCPQRRSSFGVGAKRLPFEVRSPFSLSAGGLDRKPLPWRLVLALLELVGIMVSMTPFSRPNKADAANPAIASRFHGGCPWRGVADPGR